MTDPRSANLETLIRYGAGKGWWRSGRATRYFFEHQLFRDVALEGKKVLDIGCGRGIHTLWARASGALTVTAVEPAAAGSRSSNVLDTLRRAIADLDYEGVSISENTFQAFDPGGETYDIALLSASVNHLDEAACISLHESDSAKAVYREIFCRLIAQLNPNATVIITDVSSRNLFGDLGLRNPFSPTIEWHKHQPPEVWVELLRDVGFVAPRTTWVSPSQYFQLGVIFRNALFNYFHSSLFRIVARAPG